MFNILICIKSYCILQSFSFIFDAIDNYMQINQQQNSHNKIIEVNTIFSAIHIHFL